MTAHDLTALCERLRQLPREAGDFSIRAQDARVQFGLGEPELEALRNAGLCGASADGAPTYANSDLHYIGLRCRLANDILTGINLWRTSLEQLVAAEATVRITYLTKVPGAAGPVDGRVMLPGNPDHPVQLRHLSPAAEFTTHQRDHWPVVPEDIAAVIGEVAGFDFCQLPARLMGDTALARQTGLAECWTGSKLIVEGCRRIGRRARIAYGIMVTLPFSSAHSWTEVDVDGIWTPVDPLIIGLMRRWAGLDPVAWPYHRSTGAMLIPLAWDVPTLPPLVSRDGRGVPTLLVTKIAPAAG